MSNPVIVERDGRVAIVTLNRPSKLNAMSAALRTQLAEALTDADADDSVGAVVLTGAGDRAFCAGMDIGEIGNAPFSDAPNPYDAVDRFSKPIIAAVNGLCITGGLELMLACDFAIGVPAARFADTHVRLGLMPSSPGIVRLAYQVGLPRAKEMQLTGNFVSGQHAFDIGLINHLVEPDQLMPMAVALAHDLADGNFAFMMSYKAALDACYREAYGDALKTAPRHARAVRTDPEALMRAKAATMARGRGQTQEAADR
ncbi:MAG: enoyl-CoA hydratase [Phenylobacterium sp.]|uniref:enoyl-CoA hydratase n=1 Tax=Phenylobacterium sp. TaxID=1871053 RepID=UPI0027337118|nr:enoyl-CoA hydratase [Phenylobacterium sp.]MDP3174388.1 enoyl-CoA hydratase [Phenylobacterium sp.]